MEGAVGRVMNGFMGVLALLTGVAVHVIASPQLGTTAGLPMVGLGAWGLLGAIVPQIGPMRFATPGGGLPFF